MSHAAIQSQEVVFLLCVIFGWALFDAALLILTARTRRHLMRDMPAPVPSQQREDVAS